MRCSPWTYSGVFLIRDQTRLAANAAEHLDRIDADHIPLVITMFARGGKAHAGSAQLPADTVTSVHQHAAV